VVEDYPLGSLWDENSIVWHYQAVHCPSRPALPSCTVVSAGHSATSQRPCIAAGHSHGFSLTNSELRKTHNLFTDMGLSFLVCEMRVCNPSKKDFKSDNKRQRHTLGQDWRKLVLIYDLYVKISQM
jgi:hypothetical protein